MTHLSLHSRVLYLYFSVQIQISIFAKLSRIQNISWINSQYVAIDSFILSLLSRVIWFLSVRVSFWCRHRKQTCGYRREGEGGVNWESNIETYIFRSDQSLSHVRLFATPWITARQASLSITNSWNSLKLTSIESVMPSSHLILCRPPFLLPPIPLSIRIISNESTVCMRWPWNWSFSFRIIPSKEHPRLISFRMGWLDLFAVQGTLKSPLQHHSSKASIIWHSTLFTV